ncbi:hypothetical protein ACLMJK_003286 [Lecanora helva]
MRLFSFVSVFLAIRVCLALPPLVLPSLLPSINPSNISSQPSLSINDPRPPWPPAPWTYTFDSSSILAIEHYGRTFCTNNATCEQHILDGVNRIFTRIQNEWIIGRDHAEVYTENGAHFWILQDKPLPKIVAMQIIGLLSGLERVHGIREVVHGGLINYNTVAASFQLTFSGVES